MTYISAFRCIDGLVMCADTQENWGDYKQYVEKLRIVEDQRYPLALGGAGIRDLIEPIMDEISERVIDSQPKTSAELLIVLKKAVETVYRDDLPWLVVKKQERTPEFLVCAKPSHDDYCIFAIRGRRVHSKPLEKAIIGYGTPANYQFLQRMYRSNLPMQQAVMLAVYLTSLSKQIDEGVGGDTSIAVVMEDGAWVDDPEYIKKFEQMANEFRLLTDRFFLTSTDIGIPPESAFPQKLKEFEDAIVELRKEAIRYSASYLVFENRDQQYHRKDAPYPKLFGGASISVNPDESVAVREMTQEEQANLFSSAALPGSKFSRINRSRNGYYTVETLFPWSPDKTVRNLTRDEVVNHFTGSEIWGYTIDKMLDIVDQTKHFFVNSRNPSEAKDNENEKGRWFLVPKRGTRRGRRSK